MKDRLSEREIAQIEKRKLFLYLGVAKDRKFRCAERKFISLYIDKFVKIVGQQ